MDNNEQQLPPPLSKQLTEEEEKGYEENAVVLAKQYNVSKVHVHIQIDPTTKKRAVCYLTEPNYVTKIRVMDKAISHGAYTAADELRESCTLRKESDPITYSDSPESDRYKLGIVDYCVTIVKRLQNQFKKN